MNNGTLLELSALAGKIAIEHTKLPEIAKVAINCSIEIAKEYLKSEVSLDIDNIRTEAERFNLDKVIAIPIGSFMDKDLFIIRAYGQKSEDFIKHLGLHFIPESTQKNILDDIYEAEKNSGILIYEKMKFFRKGD